LKKGIPYILTVLGLAVLVLAQIYPPPPPFDGDDDMDGVQDEYDLCPDSRSGEIVDINGCDPFQFCEQFYCSTACYSADFIPLYGEPEKVLTPDCTVVIIYNEGTYEPECVPVSCLD
jgi:hypothetical protein